jgi:hypothetical protein
MTTEKIIEKIYAELEKEAYIPMTHSYDYKRTNQIIRANIESIPELLKLNKADVISSVCKTCGHPFDDDVCCGDCIDKQTD